MSRAVDRERGAALLAVLWFVAAVAALAVTFLRLATGDRFLILTPNLGHAGAGVGRGGARPDPDPAQQPGQQAAA